MTHILGPWCVWRLCPQCIHYQTLLWKDHICVSPYILYGDIFGQSNTTRIIVKVFSYFTNVETLIDSVCGSIRCTGKGALTWGCGVFFLLYLGETVLPWRFFWHWRSCYILCSCLWSRCLSWVWYWAVILEARADYGQILFYPSFSLNIGYPALRMGQKFLG